MVAFKLGHDLPERILDRFFLLPPCANATAGKGTQARVIRRQRPALTAPKHEGQGQDESVGRTAGRKDHRIMKNDLYRHW
jgi:hypothetical protein